MKIDLIIELGNSFFTIYKKGRGLILRQPSVVALRKMDKYYKLEALGQEAKSLEAIEDDTIRVFSPFSAGQINNFAYAQVLVKEFLKMAGLGFSLLKRKAVIVTDLDFNQENLEECKKLFKRTFVSPKYFVPSIYGILYSSLAEVSPQKTYGVLDLGASHMSCGVISGGSQILSGLSLKTGGKEMTLSVKQAIKKLYNLNTSFFTAQKAKEELANLTTFDSSTIKIKGLDASNYQERNQIIKAQDVKEAIKDHFSYVEKLVGFVLENLTDLELKQIKTNGIIVGGQVAKTIGLERYLKEKLLIPVFISDELDFCGVLGLSKLLEEKELLKEIALKI